jgi:anti-sigma-K factor RskA
MTSQHDDHSLIGPYATDALDERERAQFEYHLAHCQDCAEELSGFVETTARLAAATPANPPDALKSAVLSAAARTPQIPPLPATHSRLEPPKIAHSRAGQLFSIPRPASPTSRRRLVGIAAVAIILLAAAAGVFADAQRTSQHRLHNAQRNVALVQTVLSAPDATLLRAPVETGGAAHVVMSASKHALIFSASALQPLDRTQCYELWLIRHGSDERAGTLPATTNGNVGPIPMSGVQPGDTLGISVEPALGSPSPTTPMILELAL